jgi:hypothetical protein
MTIGGSASACQPQCQGYRPQSSHHRIDICERLFPGRPPSADSVYRTLWAHPHFPWCRFRARHTAAVGQNGKCQFSASITESDTAGEPRLSATLRFSGHFWSIKRVACILNQQVRPPQPCSTQKPYLHVGAYRPYERMAPIGSSPAVSKVTMNHIMAREPAHKLLSDALNQRD